MRIMCNADSTLTLKVLHQPLGVFMVRRFGRRKSSILVSSIIDTSGTVLE
jgi:hypothetical protein